MATLDDDPRVKVTIVGMYRVPLENYPDVVSTVAEAARFDEWQINEGDMGLDELVQWMQESGDDLLVTFEAVDGDG